MFIGNDESGIAPPFEVIGSVWLPNAAVADFERRVTEWRVNNHFWEEIHFNEIKDDSREFTINNYLEFLKIGFGIGAQFKSIVVPKDLTNLAIHDENERIRQLNFLALLIRNKLKSDFPNIDEEISIVSDSFMPPSTEITRREITATTNADGGTTYEIAKKVYRAIPRARERMEREIGRPVACFAQCTSHICSVIQLADLFAGSIASRFGDVSINSNRERIISSFETQFKHPFGTRTFASRKDLNIWVWRPPRPEIIIADF